MTKWMLIFKNIEEAKDCFPYVSELDGEFPVDTLYEEKIQELVEAHNLTSGELDELNNYLNENALIKHYSDKGMMLLQNETGIKYGETVDVVPCRYTYTETDEPIHIDEMTELEEKAAAYDILMGVDSE